MAEIGSEGRLALEKERLVALQYLDAMRSVLQRTDLGEAHINLLNNGHSRLQSCLIRLRKLVTGDASSVLGSRRHPDCEVKCARFLEGKPTCLTYVCEKRGP